MFLKALMYKASQREHQWHLLLWLHKIKKVHVDPWKDPNKKGFSASQVWLHLKMMKKQKVSLDGLILLGYGADL